MVQVFMKDEHVLPHQWHLLYFYNWCFIQNWWNGVCVVAKDNQGTKEMSWSAKLARVLSCVINFKYFREIVNFNYKLAFSQKKKNPK